MMRKYLAAGLLTAAMVPFAAAPASAATVSLGTLTFSCITANDVNNCGFGELQLAVEVIGDTANPNSVEFKFTNTGAQDSSITDIYFDDGTLLALSSVTNGTGVNFSAGASPGDLPGGGLGFQATAGFTADSNPPAQLNGVNPGETVSIFFTLLAGLDYDDVWAALFDDPNTLGPAALRIGIHVQGFDNGGSESFINDDPGDNLLVPEPTSLSLLVFGLAALGARRRWNAA